jgi:hypothetical protein
MNMTVTQGDLIGKEALVQRLYANSENVVEREVDHRNMGVAFWTLVE